MLNSEFPVYARNINTIETTPNTEKLTFWCMTPDDFEEPWPKIMKKEDTENDDR